MLYFITPGPIDFAAFTILGINAKTSTSPIGQFGTGSKYAIASILRWGGKLNAYVSDENWEFTAHEETSRGTSYGEIHANIYGDDGNKHRSQVLGFTTHLGSHWEPWMILRELYTNTMDEGGLVTQTWDLVQINTFTHSVIAVECPEIELAFTHREKYFLDTTPVYSDSSVEFHPLNAHTFYHNSIRTDGMSSKSSHYTYNIITHAALTEDRTFAQTTVISTILTKSIARCTDKSILYDLLHRDNRFESGLPYQSSYDYSEEFYEVAFELLRAGTLSSAYYLNDVLQSLRRRDYSKATLPKVPDSFEDMDANEPSRSAETSPGIYAYSWWAEQQITDLEAQRDYWKACALKLSGKE